MQVDNFVEYADEGSDDERSIPNVDSLLEDDIFASGYSPSVVNSSNSSKHKGDRISTAKDIPSNVDLGIELCHEATKEVCYLPGMKSDSAFVVVYINIIKPDTVTSGNCCQLKEIPERIQIN